MRNPRVLAGIVMWGLVACSGAPPNSGTGGHGGAGGTSGPAGAGGTGGNEPAICLSVSGVPSELGLDPFYKKYVDAKGIPIVSSEKVPDAALLGACSIAVQMVAHRSDVLAAMINHHTRVAVMAETEVTTDIPEHSDLYAAFPGTDWDTRARGLGATLVRPASSCAEENLLCYPTDPYHGESIMVHEFAHSMAGMGITFADAMYEQALSDAYAGALQAGKWADTYAASNKEEYWAEGVQDWFDTNIEAIPSNGIHNEINTRAELADYDPDLYALIARYFAADAWRPSCP